MVQENQCNATVEEVREKLMEIWSNAHDKNELYRKMDDWCVHKLQECRDRIISERMTIGNGDNE